MAQECVAHICTLCRKAFKTRKKCKEHVNTSHAERVSNMYGPGQYADYLWLDLGKEGRKYQ